MQLKWIKLVNFGQYNHSKGAQIFDEKAGQAIVDSFHSLRGKFLRKFQGLPLYIGHPDDPQFASKNSKVYGRIENVKVENSALWILVKWTEIGQELFNDHILKYLSPRWLTTPTKDGKLVPKRLLSVGLTNHPNIKCDHIVVQAEQSDGQQAAAAMSPTPALAQPVLPTPNAAANHESIASCDTPPYQEQPADQKQAAVRDTVQHQQENDESTTTAIDAGISQNLPMKLALNLTSQTSDLKHRTHQQSNCERLLAMVFDRMQKFSEKYHDAWMAVKRSNPALFSKNF